MELDRYIGEIIDINPKFNEIEIKWITTECLPDSYQPSIWFIYKNKMYYSISNRQLGFLEDLSDIKLKNGEIFNAFIPGEPEWYYLNLYGLTHFELDYQKAIIEGDLDEWCEYELDFIKVWLRDSKLNELGI